MGKNGQCAAKASKGQALGAAYGIKNLLLVRHANLELSEVERCPHAPREFFFKKQRPSTALRSSSDSHPFLVLFVRIVDKLGHGDIVQRGANLMRVNTVAREIGDALFF